MPKKAMLGCPRISRNFNFRDIPQNYNVQPPVATVANLCEGRGGGGGEGRGGGDDGGGLGDEGGSGVGDEAWQRRR